MFGGYQGIRTGTINTLYTCTKYTFVCSEIRITAKKLEAFKRYNVSRGLYMYVYSS